MCSYIENTRLQTSKIASFHRQLRKVFVLRVHVSAFLHTVFDGDLIVHKFAYKTDYTTLSKYKDARQTNIQVLLLW